MNKNNSMINKNKEMVKLIAIPNGEPETVFEMIYDKRHKPVIIPHGGAVHW